MLASSFQVDRLDMESYTTSQARMLRPSRQSDVTPREELGYSSNVTFPSVLASTSSTNFSAEA